MEIDKIDNENENNNFALNKCRILTLFSLFGSPISMLCKSNECI